MQETLLVTVWAIVCAIIIKQDKGWMTLPVGLVHLLIGIYLLSISDSDVADDVYTPGYQPYEIYHKGVALTIFGVVGTLLALIQFSNSKEKSESVPESQSLDSDSSEREQTHDVT